ncbi:hypothetical protein FRB90_002765 [Tulasnella sp. 427]|nr:hypothetical protein FRB90_002765 [Tulasnella sp. 427]
MLSSPDPVRFVIVEEVLDFMRQMLNAVVKLHTKGVYHGGICSPNICVYGTQMLQRKYLLLPCLRDPEQTVEIGQGHDMYFLGQVFIDVIDQSSVFHVFDDLVDWMTGIGKPQQISAEEALRRFEEVVKREEILQNSYMTIFRPERMPDHSMPMESEPQEEPELELELEPLLETAPELVNVSKEEVNGAECASVSLEDSEPTPIALIPPASRSESAESADGNPNTSESSEVVVVDNTLFEMSPVSAKPMDLPPLPPRRRGIATATRKAWGKIKRWFTPRW